MTVTDFTERLEAARQRRQAREAARAARMSPAVLSVVHTLPAVRGGSNAYARRERLLDRLADIAAMTTPLLEQRVRSLGDSLMGRGSRDRAFEFQACLGELCARRQTTHPSSHGRTSP